jgi:uncharacterized protein YbjT (DUF2867 family)
MILVTGATGRAGREVLNQLAYGSVPCRALIRNPQAACLPANIESVQGDLTIAESLDACLKDIDTVFLVWATGPNAVGAALDRILRRARRIVFLSSPYKTRHPFFQSGKANPISQMHADIESRIQASGCEFTFLRPGMFASNTLHYWWGPSIRAGADVIRWPCIEAPSAPIDDRDIAAVAVRALLDEGHSGAEYVLTGPESLTLAQQMSIIGDAIGRPLRLEEIGTGEARRELLAFFPSPHIVNMLIDAWTAAMGQPAFTTNAVAEITCSPARTFRAWATDHAAQFRD